MDAPSSNPLMSGQKSSQLQTVLHPLVLLTISDYITRHTLREQQGPIIGALLGQQNGREITIEHAFECHTRSAPEVDGGYLLDPHLFAARLEQMVTVHRERQLDFVGWYTLLPSTGPTPTVLPIHQQILEGWNESAILLGFHPEEALDRSVGSKLPLTIYESNYEVDDVKSEQDGEDKRMDDGESPLKLKFRELPYSVETDETEMICMNYVAGGGGTASAVAAKGERQARSVESNGKGKRRLVESGAGEPQPPKDGWCNAVPTREEEEMLASLTAKANAVKMLQARIRLLTKYLQRLPPSFVNGESADTDCMDTTDSTIPSLTILRQIHALVGRMDLVIPSDRAAFDSEMLQQSNDVQLVGLLNAVMQGTSQAKDVGRKFGIIESTRLSSRRTPSDVFPGGSPFSLAGSGDIFI